MEALLELRRNNHQRGKWNGVRSVYNESFRTMVDLEENCDLIRTVENEVPPGLVQCESFIRALYALSDDERDLDLRVAARLARQEVFRKPGAPELAFVVSESALRRQYGPPEVMREQIDHMVKLSRLPNVHLLSGAALGFEESRRFMRRLPPSTTDRGGGGGVPEVELQRVQRQQLR